jgi:hypothetical protein
MNHKAPLPAVQESEIVRLFVLTARLLELLDLFQAAEVPVLVLKGPVLAQLLYGDPTARSYSDLDILVRRKDAPRAARVLEENGYPLRTPFIWTSLPNLISRNKELNFVHAIGVDVDLQWEVGPAGFPFRFDPEVLWSSMTVIEIAARGVPTLNSDCLLLFLCVHGAVHAWSNRAWVRDVERLIVLRREAGQDLDWRGVLELAKRTGCLRPVLLGALLAYDLFVPAAPVPPDVLDQARAIPAVARLAGEVKQRLNADVVVGPSSFETTRFNARLTPNVWARVKCYAALLKAPTEADARLLRLPPALTGLYYPFRVVRLVGKYGLRLIRPASRPPGTASSG